MSALDPDVAALLRKYALQNALEYDGQGQVGSVMGRVMGENPDLRSQAKMLSGAIAKAVAEANALAASDGLDHIREILARENPEALEKRVKERREGLPPLPNADDGKVVLRFAPNPNGPLSFGHARGVVINSELARMHEGEVILRFDDTDTKVKVADPAAYALIEEDFTWLTGRAADRVLRASERMPVYLEYAQRTLAEGHGYVCECSGESFKEHRVGMTDCPCRNRPTEANLELWTQMNDGTLSPGDAVVRIRTDMTLPNPALRDWPALRIQDGEHPLVGTQYRVWPLLDFQSAVEDHLQGVTHIVRGKDLMDSTRKQTLLYEKFGWEYPETLYWGRVKVHEFGGFSTSRMKADIAAGKFAGWDDPRLPTLRALRRRGYDAGAIRKFWIDLGLTQKDIAVPMATLNSINAKTVDADAPRISFVREPVRIALDCAGIEMPDAIHPPIHPEHPDKGQRNWPLESACGLEVLLTPHDHADGLEKGRIRLKEFADISLQSDQGGRVEGLDREKGTPIIHWLPASLAKDAVMLLEDEGELREVEGCIEANEHAVGTILQVERMGFARIDGVDEMGRQRLVHLHD